MATWTKAEDLLLAPWVTGGRRLTEAEKVNIAAKLKRTENAVKARITGLRKMMHAMNSGLELPKPEKRKPKATIQRQCLDCKKPFDAETRFIRLCYSCKRQVDGGYNFSPYSVPGVRVA